MNRVPSIPAILQEGTEAAENWNENFMKATLYKLMIVLRTDRR